VFELLVPITFNDSLRLESGVKVTIVKDNNRSSSSSFSNTVAIDVEDNLTVVDNELLRSIAFPCSIERNNNNNNNNNNVDHVDKNCYFTIDWGRVSSSTLETNGKYIVNFRTNSGGSGGPVFSKDGKLVGIIQAGHLIQPHYGAYVEPIRNLRELIISSLNSSI